MELRTLQYFLTVAEEQNITRAAERLHMSQPPLSRQLSQLEAELGVTLFRRGKRKTELTEEGKYLVQQARSILNMAAYTEMELQHMQNSEARGTLLLGVTDTCGFSILPSVLPEFRQKYPKIGYDILCEGSSEIMRKLDEGLLDVGIIREPFETLRLEVHYLKKGSWVVLVSNANLLARRSSVSLADICAEPLFVPSRSPIFEEICSWFTESQLEPNIIGMYSQTSGILPLIAENMGICICPESAGQYADGRKLSVIPLENKEKASKIYMVREKHKIPSAAARLFWNHMKELF